MTIDTCGDSVECCTPFVVSLFTAGQQTTLPIWMLTELVRPRQRPVTNVVAVFIIVVTFIPILVAYYVTRGTENVEGSGK